MTFEESLQIGQMGETAIARWLRNKGHTVLPVYEKVIDTGKGPQLFLPDGCLVAPDMLIYRGDKVLWIESKYKTRFSWYGKGRNWVTGIDLRHYNDYLKVDQLSPWPVWLLFLHIETEPSISDLDRWKCPSSCPAGLFGSTLKSLQATESHRSDRHGKTGMVYWSIGNLKKIAELYEVCPEYKPVQPAKQMTLFAEVTG